MITFENSLLIPGDLEEVRERILQGQSLPGHDDFYFNMVEKRSDKSFVLYVKEKFYIQEAGYHVLSEAVSPHRIVWTQMDHKRFIDRIIQWDLQPQDDGVNVSYHFQAKVVGGEVGEVITRKVLEDISKEHFDRLLHEFKGQMEWVVAESKIPPAFVG